MGDKKTRTAVTVPIASESFDQSVLKNDRTLVLKHAYSLQVNLEYFFTSKFLANPKPSGPEVLGEYRRLLIC